MFRREGKGGDEVLNKKFVKQDNYNLCTSHHNLLAVRYSYFIKEFKEKQKTYY